MSIEARIAEALLGHSPPNWDYHDACYCGTPTPSPPDYCAHLAAVLVKELGLRQERRWEQPGPGYREYVPTGVVELGDWASEHLPDLIAEVERLRAEQEVLRRALGDTQDETHRWRTKVCAALGVLPEIGPSMAAEMVTTLRERLRPRRIESVTELDALEVGAVVRDAEGWVWELTPSKWWGIGYGADQMKSSNINLPALLIWEPEAQ